MVVHLKCTKTKNIQKYKNYKKDKKLMATFAQLKKSRKARSESLKNKIEQDKTKSGGSDDRFWKCETDKAGNGYAVIRFLQPSPADIEAIGENAPPFVTYYRHMFKTPAGKWFVNNCPTTLGEECPVCAANSELWNTEIPANQDIVRKRKRQQKYVANILVVKDSKNPANEGKVFLFEFGQKIYKKIEGMMFPEFEDEVAVDPFDFWSGADFKLKIRQVDGYTNYDKSEFDTPAPISEDDDAIEVIWNAAYPLQEFLDPKQYKAYDKLQNEFNRAINGKAQNDTAEDAPEASYRKPSKADNMATGSDEDAVPFDTSDSDDDADMFQKMLDEDDD